MATLKERLEQKKRDFEKVLKGEFLKPNGERLELINIQAKFIKDAIPSIDYMLMILDGKVVLPKENEYEDSSCGKVFGWMQGSLVNITIAETIVYGKWSNVTDYFKCMYMSFADYVNELYDNDDTDTDSYLADEGNDACDVNKEDKTNECKSGVSLADEVNEASSEEEDDDCRYCGEHGDCCDCLDVPNDCCDIF